MLKIPNITRKSPTGWGFLVKFRPVKFSVGGRKELDLKYVHKFFMKIISSCS